MIMINNDDFMLHLTQEFKAKLKILQDRIATALILQ